MEQNKYNKTSGPRPVYLNLFKIWLPVGGIVSIAHRVSGVLLVLALPYLIFTFQVSLAGEEGFSIARRCVSSLSGRIFTLIFVAMFAHHFFAGLRHLIMDLDIGVELSAARRSAWAVLVAVTAVVIYVGVRIFA